MSKNYDPVFERYLNEQGEDILKITTKFPEKKGIVPEYEKNLKAEKKAWEEYHQGMLGKIPENKNIDPDYVNKLTELQNDPIAQRYMERHKINPIKTDSVDKVREIISELKTIGESISNDVRYILTFNSGHGNSQVVSPTLPRVDFIPDTDKVRILTNDIHGMKHEIITDFYHIVANK